MISNVFCIYARKSVYTKEGESIENQINTCRNYIERHFSNVSNKQVFVYKDEGFSGKDTKRPQYIAMMKAIEKIKGGYIVCYKLDRISRSISDFASLIDKISKKNISFVSVKEHFFVVGSELRGRNSHFGYIDSCFGRFNSGFILYLVESEKHLAFAHALTFINMHFCDKAGHLGANVNVGATFDSRGIRTVEICT